VDEVAEKLDRINRTLERHNEILSARFAVAQKPKSRFTQVMEVLALIAGAVAILSSVEIIRLWVTGG